MSLKYKNQSGQAVLIVLLSLSVVLIIVLYIMSRSITDISLSNKDEDSMRAFSAAEAGIERALVIGAGGDGSFDNANFSASVSEFGQGADKVVYPISLKSGEIATFWFSRPSETSFSGNQVKVCWGDSGTSSSTPVTPAVEITVFYKNGAVYQVFRTSLDPYSSRTTSNYFSTATVSSCTIDSESFAFQSTVSLSGLPAGSSLQFMTVKLLYNTAVSHKVGIDVSGSTGSYLLLPSQGKKVDSNGSSADSNRSIEVYQLHPVAPSIFMNSIFSSSGITKS